MLLSWTSVSVSVLAFSSSAAATARPWARSFQDRLQEEPRGFVDTDGIVHLPLVAKRVRSDRSRQTRWRRDIRQQAIGDVYDNAYFISVDVGGQVLPLQIDTGSSDLWAATSACTTHECSLGVQLSEPSASPTNATGVIGSSNVSLASWTIPQTTIAAIDLTDNTIVEVSGGILGLAFPTESRAVATLFYSHLSSDASLQSLTSGEQAQAFVESLSEVGGPFARLAWGTGGQWPTPSFALSLQRLWDPEISNVGLLTMGGLPSGILPEDLIYVDVYQYTPSNVYSKSALPFVDDLPDLPFQFTVKIDGIMVGGELLPNSSSGGEFVSENGVYAMLDSGTTAVLGPSDVVEQLLTQIGVDASTGKVPCDTKFEVSVVIAGQEFPIDPLDWLSIGDGSSRPMCTFYLGTMDAPSAGSVSSWILGDVFLKNVLAHFSYGSSPSSPSSTAVQPAQIGFLSTTNATASSSRFSSLFPSTLAGLRVGPLPSVASVQPATATTSDPMPVPSEFVTSQPVRPAPTATPAAFPQGVKKSHGELIKPTTALGLFALVVTALCL